MSSSTGEPVGAALCLALVAAIPAGLLTVGQDSRGTAQADAAQVGGEGWGTRL